MEHKGYNNSISGRKHNYGFNGIELTENLDVNLYEMPLRQYDPAIARWTTIDPITHYSQSTYTGFDNNPVYWADPSGAAVEQIAGGTRYTEEHAKVAFLTYRNQSNSNSGPQDHIRINSKTKKAEVFEDDNDYDTVETDGEITYAKKGTTESRLAAEGYSIRHTQGVGMGAFDNAVLMLSGEAAFAWALRGLRATWAAWLGRGASKLDDASMTVLGASEQAAILGGNAASKWPWKKTTASIAELTAGGGNCLYCAKKIQAAIGGQIINIVPRNSFIKFIGPMRNKAGQIISESFQIHHAVRKGDMIFDRVTGPNGMHIDNYKKLFDYASDLIFN